MLDDGVDYAYFIDTGVLFLDRQTASTLHPDITTDGGAFVAISIDELDPTEAFAARLIAPYTFGLAEAGEPDDLLLMDRTGDVAGFTRYETEIDGAQIAIDLDLSGALRSTVEVGPFQPGSDVQFRQALTYAPAIPGTDDRSCC